jgi:hypothetical protein
MYALSRENKTRKSMPAAGMVLIALALALLSWLAHYVIINVLGYGETREIRIVDTQRGVNYDFSAGASFYSFDARFFYFCTKDGMKYISSGGDVRWQEPFNLTKPVMATHSEWVAVGEERGRRIFVFNPDGLAYSQVFDHPVLTFSVNQTGYLAVVLQLDQGYAIHIYNRRNAITPLYENIIHDPTVTPTSVTVSHDGRYAVIALLDYSIRLSSRVLFCFVNAFDARDTPDGMFMAEELANQIVHEVRFMADNRVLVISDTQILCYQPYEGNFPDAQWQIHLQNKIGPLAFYGDSRFAYVTGDRFLNADEAAEPGEVRIYSVNGDHTGSFRLGRRATYLSMGHSHAIVGAGRQFYVLNHRGNRVWDYQTMFETRDFIFLENTDTVLVAGGARASVLKRERMRAGEPVIEMETPQGF